MEKKTDHAEALRLTKASLRNPLPMIETSGRRSTLAPGSVAEAIREVMKTPLDITGRVPLRTAAGAIAAKNGVETVTSNGRTTVRLADGADANEELLELRKIIAALFEGISRATDVLNKNVRRAVEIKREIRLAKKA